MNSQTLLSLYLVLHISGFTLMGGTIIADFAVYRRLNKYLITDKNKALTMLESSAIFPVLISIGAALLIITGVSMVIVIPGFTGMLWFRIKMILVLFIILNGALMARPAGTRLKKSLLENTNADNAKIEGLKNKLSIIYISQLILLLVIFTLSVFKF